ncbi:hypothetical protein FRB95_014289 [Tulasnella sp. JGI-2019a]|nr:hypothetical protein FRB95_014289 [Tulasnella sp. JGI-2019a]
MVSPDLVNLDLDCGPRREKGRREEKKKKEDTQILESTMIELSSCTIFRLFIDFDATQFILEHVRAPVCTYFSLNVSMDSSQLVVVKTPLVMSTLDTALGHDSRRSIEISASLLRFNSNGPTNFYVRLSGDNSPSSSLAWLLDHGHQQSYNPPTSIEIVSGSDDPFPLIRHLLVMLSPSITSLELNIDVSPNRAIQFLTHPRWMDGVLQWPFPSLETLSFKHCPKFDLRILVQMVESRLGRSVLHESSQLQDLGKLPTKLLELLLLRAMAHSGSLGPAVTRLNELVRSVRMA